MASARSILILSVLLLAADPLPGQAPPAPSGTTSSPVHSLRVRLLSTMLTDFQGIGEWGFAALVELDGRTILFDTGARPQTVLDNARDLNLDLSGVTDVIISHHHWDHTGGLLSLRRALSGQNPAALSRAHVASGSFLSRPSSQGEETNPLIALRPEYEQSGGRFVIHEGPAEIAPGAWLTGPVPRRHQERNWPAAGRVLTPQGLEEDSIPEDSSLIIDTSRGLVVITGCGHAGVINTLEYARATVRRAPIYALIGGLHLFQASDQTLEWTGTQLRDFGLGHLLGAHCTGIEAVFQLRRLAQLPRRTAVVGSVGASFSLEEGIDPLGLAR